MDDEVDWDDTFGEDDWRKGSNVVAAAGYEDEDVMSLGVGDDAAQATGELFSISPSSFLYNSPEGREGV
jgi:hypothetical protein